MNTNFIKIVQVRAERINICNSCEYKILKLEMEVCSKCSCLIKGKASLPLAKCPIDKWDKM